MIDHLGRQFEHMKWADRRALEMLRATPEPEAVRLMAHLIAAERVWLTRLRGEDSSPLEIWPATDLGGCAALAEEVHRGFDLYLATLTPERLAAPVSYRNQRGSSFATSCVDILTHVLTHGSYHRGQIARAVRQAGGEPANTDYISWAREAGAS